MVDISNIRDFPLKAIFLAHFLLTSLTTLGYWAPNSYIFYNFLFLTLLLWALHSKQSEDPVQLAISINSCAVLFDIMILALYFPNGFGNRLSAVVGVLHLIGRPFSTIYLLQVLRDREGVSGTEGVVGSIFPSQPRQNYEDIDRSAGQASYDFSTAQEI